MAVKTFIFPFAIAFYLIHLPSSSDAQEFSLGRCPPFPTVKNFNLERVNNT